MSKIGICADPHITDRHRCRQDNFLETVIKKLDYIAELSKKYYIMLEFGIESCYDKTLERINRGHNFSQTRWAISQSVERDIKTGGHIFLAYLVKQKFKC